MRKPIVFFAPLVCGMAAAVLATAAHAKLPVAAPSDEAKAKAAEAAAKTAHGNKVEAYKLCKSMDKVAAHYAKTAAAAKKEVKPATATPPCADPGPYVAAAPAAPAVAAAPAAPAATAAPAVAAAPAPAAATAAKPAAAAEATKASAKKS